MKRKIMTYLSLGLICMNLMSCSGKSVDENNPKDLYEDAESEIENDRFLIALDKLKALKSKFSYTSYGVLAQLRIADVYFLQESFPEAAAAYEAFYELYPKHEKAGYALFREGESHYHDMPTTIARDLRSGESAISAFDSYINRFSSGEYIEQAKDLRLKAFNVLAEKELDIAKFYIKRKKPDAARLRLQKVLDQFGSSTSAEEAKTLLRGLNQD